MGWLWSLPFVPLLLCGGMCVGGALLALVVGKKAGSRKDDESARASENQDVS